VRILYVVGFGGWWGKYPPDVLDREDAGTVGGGETCALRTAAGLVALGHDVVVASVAQPGTWRGVRFVSGADAFRTYLRDGPWDAVVAWSDPRPLLWASEREGRVLVQQLNDLDFQGAWWKYVDVISAASANHERFLQSVCWPEAKVACDWSVVHNAVDMSLYPDPVPEPSARPPWVGYWSSPDRGLHHLLAAWPGIRKAVPDAELRIYYQIRRYLEMVVASSDVGPSWGLQIALTLRGQLDRLAGCGVTVVDAVPRRVLARDQMKCRVLAYPCAPQGYTEGFGQSVPEAMAAGCLPVVRCTDAFADLWAPFCWNLQEDPADPAFTDEITSKVVAGLTTWDDHGPSQAELRACAAKWSWDRSAKAAEDAIVRAIAWRHRRSQEAA